MSQLIRFNLIGLKLGDSQTHAPDTEGPHSVGVWTLKVNVYNNFIQTVAIMFTILKYAVVDCHILIYKISHCKERINWQNVLLRKTVKMQESSPEPCYDGAIGTNNQIACISDIFKSHHRMSYSTF